MTQPLFHSPVVAPVVAQPGRRVTPQGRRRAAARPEGAAAPALPELSALTRWCVAVAIFLPISKFHGWLSVLATIRAPLLMSLVSLALLATSISIWKPKHLMKSWVVRCMAGIVLLAVLSVPAGIYPGNSFTFIHESLMTTVLLCVMALAVARTPDGLRFMVRVVTLACFTAGALALVSGRRDDSGRLAGAFSYDPNDLALVCAIGIPLAVWWLMDKTSKLRWLMLVCIPVMINAAVGSESRGGFLALMAICAGFVIFGVRSPRKGVRNLSLILAVAGVCSYPLLPASYREKISTISSDNDYNRTSPRGRKEVWKRGIGYAIDRPILGVGVDNFNTAEGHLSDLARNLQPGQGHKWSTAHNSVVQITAELGFGGGILFIAIVLGSARLLGRRATAKLLDDTLPMFLATALLAFAVGGFFLSFAYYELTWILWSLSAATLMQARRAQLARRAGLPARR